MPSKRHDRPYAHNVVQAILRAAATLAQEDRPGGDEAKADRAYEKLLGLLERNLASGNERVVRAALESAPDAEVEDELRDAIQLLAEEALVTDAAGAKVAARISLFALPVILTVTAVGWEAQIPHVLPGVEALVKT